MPGPALARSPRFSTVVQVHTWHVRTIKFSVFSSTFIAYPGSLLYFASGVYCPLEYFQSEWVRPSYKPGRATCFPLEALFSIIITFKTLRIGICQLQLDFPKEQTPLAAF